jgi:hypothetical protein
MRSVKSNSENDALNSNKIGIKIIKGQILNKINMKIIRVRRGGKE